MNPYESPQKADTLTSPSSRRLDRGVLAIATFMFAGCLLSIIGVVVPAVNALLMPRFGWIGLFLSVNVLIFVGFWVKYPSRRTLLPASFMSCAIGAINGLSLLRTGTVAVVQNAFHDRLHSAWIWSVGLYVCAGIYFAIAAYRHKHITSDQLPDNPAMHDERRSHF
jgi:phosphate/sulfate permease